MPWVCLEQRLDSSHTAGHWSSWLWEPNLHQSSILLGIWSCLNTFFPDPDRPILPRYPHLHCPQMEPLFERHGGKVSRGLRASQKHRSWSRPHSFSAAYGNLRCSIWRGNDHRQARWWQHRLMPSFTVASTNWIANRYSCLYILPQKCRCKW